MKGEGESEHALPPSHGRLRAPSWLAVVEREGVTNGDSAVSLVVESYWKIVEPYVKYSMGHQEAGEDWADQYLASPSIQVSIPFILFTMILYVCSGIWLKLHGMIFFKSFGHGNTTSS